MSNGNSGNYKTTISKIYFNISDVFVDQAKALRSPTFLVKPATIRVYPDHTIRFFKKILVPRPLNTILILHIFFSINVFHYIPIFVHFVLSGHTTQPSSSHTYTRTFSYSTTSKDQYNYIDILTTTVTVICTPIQYF